MKLLYVTDLHGDKQKYNHLIDLAKATRADVVINGGDMLPKDGDLFEQDDFITGYLAGHFSALEEAEIHYLCYLGNDDLGIFDTIFSSTCKRFSHVIDLAQRSVKIGQYEFIGMNMVVDYPFRLKDRCRKDTADYVIQRQFGSALLSTPKGWREIMDWAGYIKKVSTLEDELGRLPKPQDASKTVYVIHMPPHTLGLDKCYNGEEVGSKAVYDFLQRTQPCLSLHGHIHESPEMSGEWKAKLKKTVCIQPGQTGEGLLTYITGMIETVKSISWSRKEERIISAVEERIGAVLLSKKQLSPNDNEAARILCDEIRTNPSILQFTLDDQQFIARVSLMKKIFSQEPWPDLTPSHLVAHPEDWVMPWLGSVRTIQHLRALKFLPALRSLLTREQQRLLESRAPLSLIVPSGNRIQLDYVSGDQPVLAVKLQELFGLADTPRIAEHRVPVLLHLLSPARKPVQITQDLRAFWNTGYQLVKKDLRGRYTKHPWPDDPWSAVPTARAKPRKK